MSKCQPTWSSFASSSSFLSSSQYTFVYYSCITRPFQYKAILFSHRNTFFDALLNVDQRTCIDLRREIRLFATNWNLKKIFGIWNFCFFFSFAYVNKIYYYLFLRRMRRIIVSKKFEEYRIVNTRKEEIKRSWDCL